MNAGVIMQIVGLAVRAAEAIIAAGKDPVVEIRRLLSAAPEVAAVDAEFDALIDARFPRRERPITGAPAAGESADDVYEGD